MFNSPIHPVIYIHFQFQNGSETTSGVIDAITDFIQSFFDDDDTGGEDVNSGNPVPVMEDTPSSAEFIAARIAADTGWAKEEMVPYSARLAKTLSQLSAKEQAVVFYGSN